MECARSPRPLISVIVPHLDQQDYLEACLLSLEAQTLEQPLFEIIVVDNGSISPPHAQVSRHPGVRLLQEATPGPGPARNHGAKFAAGGILCFIDADCRADPNWLEVVLRTFNSAPEGIILGGDVQIWRDDKQRYTAIEAYESIFGYRQKMHVERFGFSGSGNLAVRTADFEKVGPFAGIMLAEDKDWGNRARAVGFKFKYVAQMIVFHPARPSLEQLCVQWDRLIRHALTMTRQGSHWRIRWTARAFAVLASPFVDIVEVAKSPHISGWSARFKAFVVLVVIRSYRAWRMMAMLRSPDKGVVWNRDNAVGTVETD